MLARLVLLLAVTGTMTLLGQAALSANGIGTLVREQVAGPYRVRVGIQPYPPVTGRLVMTVWLVEELSGEPVPDADVVALASGPGAGAQGGLMMDFNGDPWDLFHQHAAISVPEPGSWTFEIAIEGRLGSGAVTVPLDFAREIPAQSGEGSPILPLVIFAAVVGASLLLGLILRLREARRSRVAS
ncbi:MAG: hypothetical protein L0177_13780 [Chloroflexi bacterium]|nr:hypothetical protein [Chloroflexota bacterium]